LTIKVSNLTGLDTEIAVKTEADSATAPTFKEHLGSGRFWNGRSASHTMIDVAK
jgi:hypothetical protein